MRTSDFNYELPKELIAQEPPERRDGCRLMALSRSTGTIAHRTFSDITEYLREGDCLVLNNTKVIPARLIGERDPSGGRAELLLLRRRGTDIWETIARPGRRLRKGARLSFGGGLLKAEIRDVLDDGNRLVEFSYEGIFEEVLDSLGRMPLPPYITKELKDNDSYQTVYAKYEGSAAAPTAGLHFTKELLEEIGGMGVDIAQVTLHVGLGTFRPVKAEDVESHHMHSEFYRVGGQAAEAINSAKKNGGRIICVGTTSCRTIESAADEDGTVYPGEGDTDIFIYPGYSFKVMDGLITNFHLPESTLLMLVSAFAGRENVLNAYREAVRAGYKFFSFGDAMVVI